MNPDLAPKLMFFLPAPPQMARTTSSYVQETDIAGGWKKLELAPLSREGRMLTGVL